MKVSFDLNAFILARDKLHVPVLNEIPSIFHHVHCITKGTYGEVYSATDRSNGKKVAIKILESITDNLEEIEEEYLVLRDLSQHSNLPTFVGMFLQKGVCFEDDQLWFVMEVVFFFVFPRSICFEIQFDVSINRLNFALFLCSCAPVAQ